MITTKLYTPSCSLSPPINATDRFKTTRLLQAAVEFFHNRHDLLNETKARYYAGWAEAQATNYQKALLEALHAIDLAKEAQDTFWMARTHDLASEIYMKNYDTHNAASEAEKAAFYFKKAGATSFHRYSLFMKMAALSYPRNIDGTQVKNGDSLLDSLLFVYKSDSDSLMIAECLNKKIRKYVTCKDFARCEAAIDSLSQYTQSIHIHNAVLPYLITTGLKRGKNVDKLMKEFNSLKRTSVYDTLSYLQYKKDWFTLQGNLDKVNAVADSMIFFYTKVLSEKTNNSLESVKSDYHAMISVNKEQENKELKSHNHHLWIFLLFSLLIVGILFDLTTSYFLHKRREFMDQLMTIKNEKDSLNSSIIKKEKLFEEIRNEKEALLKKAQKENERLKSNISLKNEVISKKNEVISKKNERLIDYESKVKLADAEKDLLQGKIKRIKASETKYLQGLSPKSSLLGNRLDTIFSLVTNFFDEDKPETAKNILYDNVTKEVKKIRSKKFLMDFVEEVDTAHEKILSRLKQQLPSTKDEDQPWLALIAVGVTPLTICFILQMNSSTLYSKRRRLRSQIKESSCVDKNEFLAIFGDIKDNSPIQS